MVRCLNSQPTMKNNTLAPTIESMSKFVMPPMGSGFIVEAQPKMKNELNILLPITLPIAIPGFFLSAAVMEVASSGKEVPAATIVSPTTDSLMPILIAMPLAPSTKNCPPKISPKRPPRIKSVALMPDMVFTSSALSSPPPFVAIEKV